MDNLATHLPPKYTTLGVAASHVGLSIRNLERRIARGQLTLYRVGRRRLVRVEDLERMVESGLVAPAPA